MILRNDPDLRRGKIGIKMTPGKVVFSRSFAAISRLPLEGKLSAEWLTDEVELAD